MKYKGKMEYPKPEDKFPINRYGVTYVITSLSKNNIKQGDLVLGYEKGIHCVLGWVKADLGYGRYGDELVLLKRVYSDKIQPTKGNLSVCCSALCKSPKKFFQEYKEKFTSALNIINEYLG